jgi:hypothetical protein
MKKREHFDAVGFMRAVRDRMSKEISGMTAQQQTTYIRKMSGVSLRKRTPVSAQTHS